jgi:hypothetical protein
LRARRLRKPHDLVHREKEPIMARLLFLSVALAVAVTATGAIAKTLTPSTIVADPASYDGKAVTVSGTVAHFQTSKTLLGTVAGFQLCDSACIVVIDEKNSTHQNGDKVTVSGTFHVTFKGQRRMFSNAVVIK